MSLDDFVRDVINEIEGCIISDKVLWALTYPLKFQRDKFEFAADYEVDFVKLYLPRVFTKIICVYHSSQRTELHKLLRHCSLHSKSDLWLECMLNNLSSSRTNALLDELIFFIFEAQRLKDVVAVSLHSPDQGSKQSKMEQCARMICNIPVYVANAFPQCRGLKLFNRKCFVDIVLSSVGGGDGCSEDTLSFYAHLITHLNLTGHSVEFISYIINTIPGNYELWSKVFVRVQEKYLETCILPLLTTNEGSLRSILILSRLLMECDDRKMDFVMKLFRRLFYVRLFSPNNPARMIFPALFKVVTMLQRDQSTILSQKVDDLLGLPSLRLWSDSTSILNSSIERHTYTCQIMLSWFTDFRIPLSSAHSNPSLDSLLPEILAGISNHLGSPRKEIRILGMAVGEWITSRIELFPKSDEEHSLKFEYEEIDLLAKIRPYFSPFTACNSEAPIPTDEVGVSDNTPKFEETMNQTSEENILDSDDDPDPEDPQESSFQLLPRRPTDALDDKRNPGQLKKPRYLRECLDGMLLSKTEDNSINLACTLAATELIYSHPEAAKELAVDFARVLVHVQPPVSSNQTEIDEARHKTLIAIGVVAPKECARYLTHEFSQSGYSVGQKLSILSALKSIACELAGGDLSEVSRNVSEKCLNKADLNPKTRRYFKKAEKPKDHVNRFGPLAGEFFFPLLHSIPQLSKDSVTSHFAHQDSCLLSNLLASLATIYACARYSPSQSKMARELIGLIPVLHRHPEPAVRRALLIAVGTVITATPLEVLTGHSQILFNPSLTISSAGDSESPFILNWLRASSAGETDSECQILASSGLLALVERLREMKLS